jgi:subtilisin family serine protease
MGFWKNVGPISSILMFLLISYSVLTLSEISLFQVEGQRFDISALQDKKDEIRDEAQDYAKKLREVTGEIIPNDYIVVMKDDFLSSIHSLAGKVQSEGATVEHIFDHVLPGFAVNVPNDEVLETIMQNPNVDYVQPDVKVKVFAQNLPTGVNRIDGDLSSTKSGDSSGSVNADIAILDTGIDLNHPDLNVYKQVTFVPGTSNADDDDGHGTAVAGVAAAKDNSQGVVGVAPGARLWAIKVLDSNGMGSGSDIIKGIDYVTEHADEIEVVNLSFGAVGKNDALHNAIIRSVEAGVTYATAAGNEGMDASNVFPASFPEVIAVSAIVDTDGKCGGISTVSTTAGKDDTFASFSNYGPVVDLAAPGVLVKTTTIGDSYMSFSGTSAATAHVTGAVALYKSEHPDASPSDILNALKNLGSKQNTQCDGNGHGYFSGDSDDNAEPLLYVGR